MSVDESLLTLSGVGRCSHSEGGSSTVDVACQTVSRFTKVSSRENFISCSERGGCIPYSPSLYADAQGFHLLETWQVINKFTKANKQ